MKKFLLFASVFIFLFTSFKPFTQAKYLDNKGRVWDSKTEYQQFMHLKVTPKKKLPAKKAVPKKHPIK